MYPASFEYHAPRSVDEAVGLLVEHGGDAKLLAGGHSLIPIMKLRFAQPGHLIDVRRISGLSSIRESDGHIVIGATTTHAALERSDLLRRRLPILPEAAGQIGDVQVRNMGTIGGSLAHADPGADLPAVMLAVEAEIAAVGPNGMRTIAARDFFVDIFTSALAPTEMLTEVRIPLPGPGTGGAYAKHPHPASRYALAGAAAIVTLTGGKIARTRLARTGVWSKATRAEAAEQALTGTSGDASAIDAAASRFAEDPALHADLHGSVAYKANLVYVQAQRAIARALARARGG